MINIIPSSIKKIIFCTLFLVPFILSAQVNLKTIRKASWQTFVYRIPADSAEKYLEKDTIPVDQFLNQLPAYVFPKDSVNEDSISIGNYVLVSVNDNNVVSRIINKTNLFVYPIDNKYRSQIEVRNDKAEFINDAKVFINDKLIPFNAESGTYWINQKRNKSAFIKVYAPGDTTFLQWKEDDENKHFVPIWKQRLVNIKKRFIGKNITNAGNSIARLFVKKYKRYHYRIVRNRKKADDGFVVFNQPKYKLTDTVKLKAYIINKHKNRYRKEVGVYLEYSKNYEKKSQFLATVKPHSPGSYIYSFPLSDTLPQDISANIVFKTGKKKKIITGNLILEDYVLDEIGKYGLRTDKENYYPGDTMQFYATATDANNLPLLDAKARITLTTTNIFSFDKDSVYIPDTLFSEEKPMNTKGDTKFSISTGIFPIADLEIKATVAIRNSNNEIQERRETIYYKTGDKVLTSKVIADTVYADYLVNNKIIKSAGELIIHYDKKEHREKIEFPYKTKIDPLVEKYSFYVFNNGKLIESKDHRIDENYNISLTNISIKDTIGFMLYNANKIPVNFIVLDGNKLIATGKSSEPVISWNKKVHFKRTLYKVKWQYYWAGIVEDGNENIGLSYNKLNVDIQSDANIFPGQTDTVKVVVKNYKDRAANQVNLTAFSYNGQFKSDIRIPRLPNTDRYKLRNTLLHHSFITNKDHLKNTHSYLLGNHQHWIQRLGLDTMVYYKMLFPTDTVYDVATHIKDNSAQLAIHVTKNGVPQEIFLLYINRQLVYYNGVTDHMNYTYSTMPGYIQIGIRLYDQYIQIDSIYTQGYYKHDLVVDLDKLPANAYIKKISPFYTWEEKNLLESTILKIDDSKSDSYDSTYIWQYETLVKIYRNSNNSSCHLVGPFAGEYTIHSFAPGYYDAQFKFEPQYRYGLSKQLVRLEKSDLFPYCKKGVALIKPKNSIWILGDTLPVIPEIKHEQKSIRPYINYNYSYIYSSHNVNDGRLQLKYKKDSVVQYLIIIGKDYSNHIVLYHYESPYLPAGYYDILVVTNHFNTQVLQHIHIKANHTLCINTTNIPYVQNNEMVNKLIDESMHPVVEPKHTDETNTETNLPLIYFTGKILITGKVIDGKGKLPVSGASILIEGAERMGTLTNLNGDFILKVPEKKSITLYIKSLGYTNKKIVIHLKEDVTVMGTIEIERSLQSLQDVVVVAYQSIKKADMVPHMKMSPSYGGRVPASGKVAGLSETIIKEEEIKGVEILVRGIGSISPSATPIYIVDGVEVEDGLSKINPNDIETVNVLKDAAATAIYGSKGAKGVIIITTKNKGAIRSKFVDYAFWQPELFTDKNGESKFVVKYPDNITSWETYILAMDKHKRSGKGSILVRSFKPIMAQLSLPQFLIEGDSVQLIGKSLNYTNTEYNIHTKFGINGMIMQEDNQPLKSKESFISRFSYTVPKTDSLKASFSLQTTTGFNDGEKRAIPVMPKGVEESTGNFWVMNADTTVRFTKDSRAGSVHLTVVNNALDVLLSEIEGLRKYPYYCMEQTTSKLRGLIMEKQIKEALNQPYTDQKEYDFLLQKIQKAQLYEGGWGWWESSHYNVHITNYILHALIQIRNTNPLIETSVRNGLLFLQNQLPQMNKYDLFESLLTMSEAKHVIDYSPWLSKIHFDSLSQHQQWQWVKIMQNTGGEHSRELQQLLGKSIPTMLGGIHWGENNYSWYSNAVATTVIAFDVLSNDKDGVVLLPQIMQYFMENRKRGYWNNTVESASIVSTILPYILKTNKDFNKPATIAITGDTSVTVTKFPYQVDFKNSNIIHLNISKQGGGLVFLSAYQQLWNNEPQRVDSNFAINTHFEKNGQEISTIQSGEKIKMIVKINALKDADYVMIEIPIPAGCIYASKPQDEYDMHKEYYKNKVVMFAEYLHKGEHTFYIDLEPRYNGQYTLNPTKAELMYFPTFYGRNTMGKVDIQE